MLLVKLAVVEFSVWRGEGGCGQCISTSVWCRGNIFFTVKIMATSSDLVADDITNLIILAMVRMGPLCRGIGSSSERNM